MLRITHMELQNMLHYNPLTGIFTWRVNRGRNAKIGESAGRPDKNGYLRIAISGNEYRVARLAWFYMHCQWPVGVIDHIDRDITNNAISNLREATLSQNQGNRIAAINSECKIKGVSFDSARMKFVAYITRNNKRKNLGRYNTAEEAAAAYAKAAQEYFGEFART
jgi:hypothetical protein